MGEMRSRVSSLGTLTRPWATCTIVRNYVLVCHHTGLELRAIFCRSSPTVLCPRGTARFILKSF